jgi:Stress responsive A/B Barrel Domain
MITHIVTLKLSADAPAGRAEEIAAALLQLPAVIPEIKSYRVGPDLGLNEDNYDLALVAQFDDEAGYRAYATAPAHLAVINELVRPALAARSGVQFEG